MVCVSYEGTLKIINKLCEDHDIQVFFWGDELKSKLNERESTVSPDLYCIIKLVYAYSSRFLFNRGLIACTLHAHGSLMTTDWDDKSKMDSPISAPAYSPLSVSSDNSEAPHDDIEHDSNGTESSCSEEEHSDTLS